MIKKHLYRIIIIAIILITITNNICFGIYYGTNVMSFIDNPPKIAEWEYEYKSEDIGQNFGEAFKSSAIASLQNTFNYTGNITEYILTQTQVNIINETNDKCTVRIR